MVASGIFIIITVIRHLISGIRKDLLEITAFELGLKKIMFLPNTLDKN